MTSREKVTRGLFIHIYYTLEYGKKKKKKNQRSKEISYSTFFPDFKSFYRVIADIFTLVCPR